MPSDGALPSEAAGRVEKVAAGLGVVRKALSSDVATEQSTLGQNNSAVTADGPLPAFPAPFPAPRA